MMQNSNIIETINLSKYYKNIRAVDSVSLHVKKGEIYGFLGLNGAGKTTAIRMLLGMIQPVSGEARLFGSSIKPGGSGPWEKIGCLVEIPFSYPELTVKENLESIISLRRLKSKNAYKKIISLLKLKPYENVKARHLSLGNSQRLGLAKAMVHRPEVLILDEPTNGLDPAGIVEIRELIKDYAHNHGITVFISSHNLSEISKTATRIGIIHNGQLIQEIDTDMLGSLLRRELRIRVRNTEKAVSLLKKNNYKLKQTDDGMLSIKDPEICKNPELINSLLVKAGYPPFYLKVHSENLETYFLRIIGEEKC
jgi:ABC-2 type transport system ATP-binding protein